MFKNLFIGLVAMTSLSAYAGNIEFEIETTGLGPMIGQHFEGWNIVGGQAISTGRFSIGDNGHVYSVDSTGKAQAKIGDNGIGRFDVDVSHLQATLFVLTIEPNMDADPGPSSVHIMGGDYNKSTADLTLAHGSSLGTNFQSAAGSYILAAPTGGDFNQGIWFVDPSNGAGSLSLPSLPKGWAYEGWVVNSSNGRKISTGIFHNTSEADSDGAGRYAGPLKLNFPRVPGQDVVRTPIVLNDGIHVAVITVEPYPDFDSAPSAIKILKADIGKDAAAMTPMALDNIAASIPSGKAHLK